MSAFRIDPKMPASSYQTYVISAPTETHWRRATCEEIECPGFLNGWAISISPDQLGAGFDDAIQKCGKRFEVCTVSEAEARFPGMSFAGAIKVYVFAPGQPCFAQGTDRHVTRIDKPEIFLKAGGDWRGFTTPLQRMDIEDWVEDFGEHQDNLAIKLSQG